MRVVVQEIEVRWTKASRGGAEATVREGVPLAFPLPEAVATAAGDAGDRRVALEWRSFRVEPTELGEGAFARRFELERGLGPAGEVLAVRFDDSRGRRDLRAGPRGPIVFRLAPGEWARVFHNHRESHERGDVYVRTTFSIGWFAGAVAAGVFLGTPAHAHRALVSLYRNQAG
jgi:hypothetical protein